MASQDYCTCGHPKVSHHATRGGNTTYCTVRTGADGKPCGCRRYEPPAVVCRWKHRDDAGEITHECGVPSTGQSYQDAFRRFEDHVNRCHPPCHPANERRYIAAHPEWTPRPHSPAEVAAATTYTAPAGRAA